jgi:hypothetical protein
MSLLLIPATTYDRGAARRIWSRLDQIEGYPRQHTEAEIVRIGPASQSVPIESIRTETLWPAYVRADGVVALSVGEVPDRIARRLVTYSTTTREVRQWIALGISNRGWQLVSALPGEPEDWQPVPVRDGAAGSTTGEPIPEGEE